MRKTALLTLFVLCALPLAAFCQEKRLEAELERSSASPGNPVYLNITFYGAQSSPVPEVPEVDGLRIRYVGPMTRVTIINGRTSKSITHAFLVMPTREGNYKLGPFFVDHDGITYSSSLVQLRVGSGAQQTSVVPSSVAPSAPSSQRPRTYSGDRVFLVIQAPERKVYVNEVVPLMVKLYASDVGLKGIEYPNFSNDGFSADKWLEMERSQEIYGGLRYNVLIFRRNLYALKEGVHTIGPARLSCEVIVAREPVRSSSVFGRSAFDDDFFADIFRRYETYPMDLESNPLDITVLPFPDEGRPKDFEGAVGDYDLDVRAGARKVKVGDPVTVEMTVSGKGNIDSVTVPVISNTDGFKSYEPQATKKDNKKIYEQILIPKSSDVKEIPKVSFSFFDPKTGKYVTVEKGPIPIEVGEQPESQQAMKVVSAVGGEEFIRPPEKLGQDIVHIKSDMGNLRPKGSFLYRSPVFWAAQAVPFVLFFVFCVFHRRSEKIRSDVKYARFLRAPGKARSGIRKARSFLAKNNIAKFYDAVFEVMKEYLSGKLALARGAAIDTAVVEKKLKNAECDENVLGMVREIFAACDMARYAPAALSAGDAALILEKVRETIDYLEKIKL